VFHEAAPSRHKSENGTWTGMVSLVSSGNVDVGVGDFIVSKERSELVAFTNTLGLQL
jgi:ABC-type amino acid transport substrate-binding protein